MSTLADMIPAQDHYYLLRLQKPGAYGPYAFHGSDENNVGLLVFLLLEKAEQFLMVVGKVFPATPEKVSAEQFLALAKLAGAICTADGVQVRLGKFI